MRATAAGLDLDAIAAAADAIAEFLAHTACRLPPATAIEFPAGMLAYVAADLAALTTILGAPPG